MTKQQETDRRKMVLAMEYIIANCNDELDFELWLMCGVADGDITYGNLTDLDEVDDWYIEKENFADLMELFVNILRTKPDHGKLYCGGVVSN